MLVCLVTASQWVTAKQVAGDDQVSEAKVEARALSQAFRDAARDATPSVVTILSYGQNLPDEAAPSADDQAEDDSFPDQPLDEFDQDRSDRDSDRSADREDEAGDDDDRNADESETNEDDSATPDDLPLDRTPSPVQSNDGQSLTITGLGSGVIINADGQVITNHHVVAGAKKVMVQMQDQTELEAYDIHGDPESDIATFRLRSPEPIPSATLGDSDQLEIGDWVLAIGSPFKLEATVSAGIISAKNREIKRISRGRLLQTDAAINPGNSGGPLINLDGEVVAISTAIATRNGGYQGIGFAIPINHAKWIAAELAEHGRVRRASIGITAAELNKKIATKLNLPVGAGVAVYQLIEGGAGAKAGLKQLDIITAIAGEPIRSGSSMQQIIERLPIGSMQKLTVLRAGKQLELDILIAPIEDPTDVRSGEEEEQDEPSEQSKKSDDQQKSDAPEQSDRAAQSDEASTADAATGDSDRSIDQQPAAPEASASPESSSSTETSGE